MSNEREAHLESAGREKPWRLPRASVVGCTQCHTWVGDVPWCRDAEPPELS